MGDPEDRRAGADPLAHPAPGAAAPRFVLLRFLLSGLFLALWTWKLLEPNPVPEAVSANLPGDWKFFAGKALHAGAYAFLAVLVVALPVPRHWRWYFVGLLALHGVATEIGQTFVPHRSGRVWDVLLDWTGIGLGVLAWFLARGRARGWK